MTDCAGDSSIPARAAPHTSQWSHLFAGSQNELHEFAARLGLRRSWYRPGRPRSDGTPSPFWHCDLTAGKRQQAIRLGARPVTSQDAPEIIRQRETTTAVQPPGAGPATGVPPTGRSLREQTAARLAAAGVDTANQGLIAIVRHNTQLGSAPRPPRKPSASHEVPQHIPVPGPARQIEQHDGASPAGHLHDAGSHLTAKENDGMKPTRPAGDSPALTEPCAGSAERQQDGRHPTVPGREPATAAPPAGTSAAPGMPVPDTEAPVPYWPTAKAYRETGQ